MLEVWLDLRWRDRREEEWRYGERERFFAGDLDLGEVDDLEDWEWERDRLLRCGGLSGEVMGRMAVVREGALEVGGVDKFDLVSCRACWVDDTG